MLEYCVNCGNPISTYPCKFCGYKMEISDACPRCDHGRCLTTKKLCPNKRDYINCEVFDEN